MYNKSERERAKGREEAVLPRVLCGVLWWVVREVRYKNVKVCYAHVYVYEHASLCLSVVYKFIILFQLRPLSSAFFRLQYALCSYKHIVNL